MLVKSALLRANMALDERILTIPYEGGAISSYGANLKQVFGDNFDSLAVEPKQISVSVSGHSRTRVIGGSSSQVSAHTYTMQSWPRQPVDPASGGTTILVTLDDGDDWTFRVSGPFWRLNDFLKGNMMPSNLFYRSERGTKYTVSKED